MSKHVLVISAGGVSRDARQYKVPGVRLAEQLAKEQVFELIDSPATLSGMEISCVVSELFRYLKILGILVTQERSRDIYFYNFHKAYIPLYLGCLLFRLTRPSIFLADGVNCTGLYSIGISNFSKLFNRIVSLPHIKQKLVPKKKIVQFPGCAALTPCLIHEQQIEGEALLLLYNSSFLAHNSPELLLRLSALNKEFSVTSTGTASEYENYLVAKQLTFDKKELFAIKFLGQLSLNDYYAIAQRSKAIILFRDEAVFENRYNFPSKLIEALRFGVPLISYYPISGVPCDLYLLNRDMRILTEDIDAYVVFMNTDCFKKIKRSFLLKCSGEYLRKQIYKY
jgi:glycosyltransferase involved in cell wall biosynthesis